MVRFAYRFIMSRIQNGSILFKKTIVNRHLCGSSFDSQSSSNLWQNHNKKRQHRKLELHKTLMHTYNGLIADKLTLSKFG
jgi:hypothetical protein